MFVAALIVLIIAVLLVIAAIFGGTENTTIDFGMVTAKMDTSMAFFLGMATLLLFFLSLGLFRSAAKRAAARRADRKKVSELSNKLDAYRRDERDERDEGSDVTRDDS